MSYVPIGDGGGGLPALEGFQPDIQFKDEGTNRGSAGGVTVVDFVGAGVSATEVDGTLTVTVSGGGGVSDGDKGDITVSGGGATWTIDNNVVSYAKMQDVTDARLIGRSAGSSGDPQEITVGSPITLSGGTLDFDETVALGNNARVAVAKNSGATVGTRRRLNLIEGTNVTLTVTDDAGGEEVDVTIAAASGGVSDGDKGDITVSGGGATWTIDDDAVTYAKIQDVSATDRLLGRSTAGAGIIEEITCTAAGRALLDDADAAAQRTTLSLGGLALQNFIDDSDIPADTVQFSKMQNITADRLLGRDTAGTGDIEQLTVGGGVEFTGSVGIQTSAFTGDVTKSAGGTALTIANDAVTYAKMQNVSAASRLLGRGSAGGSGDVEEITLGSGLSMSGTALSATGGAWTTVKQTADDSKTNNTLAASTYLTLSLSAATHYVIRGTAYLLVQDAAADARFDLNYSGTWTTVYCKDSRNVAGVAAGTDAVTDRIGSALPGSTDMTATVTGICIVEFELNGVTNASGTFSFRFAQVTNSATATLLKKGSYIEYMTV